MWIVILLFLSFSQADCFEFYKQVCVWPRKQIFSSGPVTAHTAVKRAMLEDHASTEASLDKFFKLLKRQILAVVDASPDHFDATVLQGSTTFSIEAAVNSATPPGGRWLILSNGYYGRHLQNVTYYSGKKFFTLHFPESTRVNPDVVDKHLQINRQYTGVAAVHLESSSGAVNDIAAIARVVRFHLPDAFMLLDCASSFGALPIDMTNVDFLITSPNKAIGGVPGVGVIIARKSALARAKATHYSYVLDLKRHFEDMEANTIPTEILKALSKALDFLLREGVVERNERFKKRNVVIRNGMRRMGFQEFLPPSISNHHLFTYLFPSEDFDLIIFSNCLESGTTPKYIFKTPRTSSVDTFRVGNMGELTDEDMYSFLADVRRCMIAMGYTLPLSHHHQEHHRNTFWF